MADTDAFKALLVRWRKGDTEARDQLIQQVYPQLKHIAQAQLRRHSGQITLRTTELAHEAFLDLCKLHGLDWQDRRHFFAIAARVTRQLLVDFLRRRGAVKRGGNIPFVRRDGIDIPCDAPLDGSVDWLSVDHALSELETLDKECAMVVEMKFFSGLTTDDIAQVLGRSNATIRRRWRFARSWLAQRLSESVSPATG